MSALFCKYGAIALYSNGLSRPEGLHPQLQVLVAADRLRNGRGVSAVGYSPHHGFPACSERAISSVLLRLTIMG